MEVMVATSITGVLSMMMGPSLMILIEAQRVKTATFELYVALETARNAAIKRNVVATVMPHDGSYSKGYAVKVGDLVLATQLGNSKVTIKASGEEIAGYDSYGRLTTSTPYHLEVSSTQYAGVPKRCLIFDPYGHPKIQFDNNRGGDCTNG
jgi:Tfp pilus assembly protein FimT